MLGQLDKVLREASTLDGVLEFREEHFWTLSFGALVWHTLYFEIVLSEYYVTEIVFLILNMPNGVKFVQTLVCFAIHAYLTFYFF